ncbi:MAG: Na+/H+ antiporter subunit E [Maritimibacter sp.]
MTRTLEPVKLFAVLLLIWVLLNNAVNPAILITGALAAGVITWFFRSGLSFLSGLNLTPAGLTATVLYILYFFKELVLANLQMASIVLKPSLPIDPAIVKVRTTLTHPVARLLLANSITLTPGTLTVEIHGEWLYIHWVRAAGTDVETATREIAAGFERYLEVMYG